MVGFPTTAVPAGSTFGWFVLRQCAGSFGCYVGSKNAVPLVPVLVPRSVAALRLVPRFGSLVWLDWMVRAVAALTWFSVHGEGMGTWTAHGGGLWGWRGSNYVCWTVLSFSPDALTVGLVLGRWHACLYRLPQHTGRAIAPLPFAVLRSAARQYY